MNYHVVLCKTWDDPTFRRLSVNAKLLFMNLLTSKLGNVIGIFIWRYGTGIIDIPPLQEAEIRSAFNEILEKEMVWYDEHISLLIMKNYLKYNPLRHKGYLTKAVKILENLPKSEIFSYFLEWLKDPLIKSKGINSEFVEVLESFVDGIHIGQASLFNGEKKTIEPEKKRPLPVEDLMETWNEICFPILSRVMNLAPGRANMIKTRLKERPDLEEWKVIFKRIIASPFLTGENDRNWRVSFDWCLKPSNLIKIVEGVYDDRGKNQNKDGLQSYAEKLLSRNQFQEGEEDAGRDIPEGDGINSGNI